MATSETQEDMCLMCLEAPAVRQVDTCQHSYCENCLSSPNFACPQCVTDGTDDHEEADRAGRAKKLPIGRELGTPTAKPHQTKTASCKVCHFKGKTVKATNICKKCKSIPLCKDCSRDHGQNEVTRKHVVTAIALQREDAKCIAHDEALDHFCTTCSDNVCHVCILIEHVGHKIETLNKVVLVEVDKVKSEMEQQKEWLEMLRSDQKELQKSKATAQEMEDVLIKSIEDHAEKCIEEILKNKETLKKQVRADFEVVREMEKRLEAMPELQRASGDVIAEANSLLNDQAELHSTYIEKLIALKQQLDKLKEGNPAYEEDKAKYQQEFRVACEKAITFYPRTPNCKIGGFNDPGPRCYAGGLCVCETCERKADASRVSECRQKGTCTCGTCGCVFDRKQLTSDGGCIACYSICPVRPRSARCLLCKQIEPGCSECSNRKPCNNKIVVRHYIP